MTRLFVVAALVLAAAPMAAAAPVATGRFEVNEVKILNGQLTVRGRTAKPNQVVVLVETGDKTASFPNRRFSFSVAYIPDNCRISLKIEPDEPTEHLVTGCAPRGKDGKDGKDGQNGKDGKDGRDGANGKNGKDGAEGIAYGALPGDGAAFQCWASDVIGLWFIKDYPGPNSRTVAHIAPERGAAAKLTVTEPDNPRKAGAPSAAAMRAAEFQDAKLYVLDRETKARTAVRGDVSPDCRSIVWKGERDAVLGTWER